MSLHMHSRNSLKLGSLLYYPMRLNINDTDGYVLMNNARPYGAFELLISDMNIQVPFRSLSVSDMSPCNTNVTPMNFYFYGVNYGSGTNNGGICSNGGLLWSPQNALIFGTSGHSIHFGAGPNNHIVHFYYYPVISPATGIQILTLQIYWNNKKTNLITLDTNKIQIRLIRTTCEQYIELRINNYKHVEQDWDSTIFDAGFIQDAADNKINGTSHVIKGNLTGREWTMMKHCYVDI